jgi:hypothetical protein
MAHYLFAVQAAGREITHAYAEVAKVSQVSAHCADGQVQIVHDGDVIATGAYTGGSPLVLARWPADDKLADPVIHPVKQEEK